MNNPEFQRPRCDCGQLLDFYLEQHEDGVEAYWYCNMDEEAERHFQERWDSLDKAHKDVLVEEAKFLITSH